jgi:hypothetical protein
MLQLSESNKLEVKQNLENEKVTKRKKESAFLRNLLL